MLSEPQGNLGVELESLESAEGQPETALEDLIASAPAPAGRISSVVLGTLAAWDEAGNPLVDYPGNPWDSFLPARSVVPLSQAALSREVALMFVEGDPRQPLILGLLQPPGARPRPEGQAPVAVEVDGERLIFTAEQEIVLRCGQASLTLTRAGKVLIRGTYLLSRSSGVNRIKGGSVQIN
jgi:hypothetical protein